MFKRQAINILVYLIITLAALMDKIIWRIVHRRIIREKGRVIISNHLLKSQMVSKA